MLAFCSSGPGFLACARPGISFFSSFSTNKWPTSLKYPSDFRRRKCARPPIISAAKRANRVERDDEAFVTCQACGSDELVSAGKLLRQGSVRVRCSQCRREWVADASTALTTDGSTLIESRSAPTSNQAGQNTNKSSGGSQTGNRSGFSPQVVKPEEIGVKLYVSGLGSKVDSELLRETFEVYGRVQDASVVCDRVSGRSKGFGFVTILGDSAASAAIDDLSGRLSFGRRLTVRKAIE